MQLYYAIGDIHGEFDRLVELHEAVFAHHRLNHPSTKMTLVHLGDYIDRGPNSFAVVDHLMNMESDDGVSVIHLRGNHEQQAVNSFRGAHCETSMESWLKWGGRETLKSYAEHGFEIIPDKHLGWMSDLPAIYKDPVAGLIFVHAGINPKRYPEGDEETYLWTRSKRFFDAGSWDNPELEGWCVVHGHTPPENFEPEHIEGRRINVDTGAVFGGKLTAVCLAPGHKPVFLHT